MNKDYTLIKRASLYAQAFPHYPPTIRADDRWLDAIWVMGNNYKGSGYYGAYPATYLKRIMALFPDAERILHLFSGSLPPGNYIRFDDKRGDILGNAEELSKYVSGPYDLILADPPYSEEDARHYGVPLINRNKVVAECAKVLEEGGFLVWLDQVLPLFTKREFELVGLIGLVISTNHRFRVASIFKRAKKEEGSNGSNQDTGRGEIRLAPAANREETEQGTGQTADADDSNLRPESA